MRGILHNRFLHFFYFTTPKRAQHHISDGRKRKKEMRIPGPAGEFARARHIWSHQSSRPPLLSTKTQEEEEEEEETTGTIQNSFNRNSRHDDDDDDDDDDDEKKRARRANDGKNEREPRQRHSAANATTTKKLLWQTLFNRSDAEDDFAFKQKQYQTIQWIKKGGWRSGRLNKGRFIVEKMKKKKRIDGTTSFLSSKDTTTVEGGDQNPTFWSSLFFDGSLLLSDENRDTITATCDGETLKMLLTQKKKTKKEKGTRVGVIVRDVAVLNASTTEQHLVLCKKSLVEVLFQEEEEDEENEGEGGKENALAVALEVEKVAKAASQPPQQKVSAFALQAMKLMEKRKAKAAAAAEKEIEERI